MCAEGARPVRRPIQDNYIEETQRPLVSLLFVAPLIVLYEVGTVLYASDSARDTQQRVHAFTMMRRFFLTFGAHSMYLPAAAVVGILIAWHLARHDPWRVRAICLLGMIVESVLMALPLFILAQVLAHYLPLAGHRTLAHSMSAGDVLRSNLVLSIGAGVYEELLFRLIGFTLLNMLLVDLFGMPQGRAAVMIVILSGLAFSGYHYLVPERFETRVFVFRALGGAWFGVLFLCRGFGISVGSHAAYDAIVFAFITGGGGA